MAKVKSLVVYDLKFMVGLELYYTSDEGIEPDYRMSNSALVSER
jgi:hypothetical protein